MTPDTPEQRAQQLEALNEKLTTNEDKCVVVFAAIDLRRMARELADANEHAKTMTNKRFEAVEQLAESRAYAENSRQAMEAAFKKLMEAMNFIPQVSQPFAHAPIAEAAATLLKALSICLTPGAVASRPNPSAGAGQSPAIISHAAGVHVDPAHEYMDPNYMTQTASAEPSVTHDGSYCLGCGVAPGEKHFSWCQPS